MAGNHQALGEKMNQSKRWGQIIAFGIITYLLIGGNRGLWHLYQLHQEKQVLTGDIDQLKVEIGRYQNEYQTFGKSTVNLEKQAREELNLIKPGEIVYKFNSSTKER